MQSGYSVNNLPEDGVLYEESPISTYSRRDIAQARQALFLGECGDSRTKIHGRSGGVSIALLSYNELHANKYSHIFQRQNCKRYGLWFWGDWFICDVPWGLICCTGR